MKDSDPGSRLEFIRKAEPLKDTLRSAYTAQAKTESVAEHSWRLCLMAITFADQYPQIDLARLLKMCVLHDLGEVVNGDIPAPLQTADKSVNERADFQSLLTDLPDSLKQEFTTLWDEYEGAATDEAKLAKALDKLETIIQHNQGCNPPGFDYRFNLTYGKKYTDNTELTAQLRVLADRDTQANADAQTNPASHRLNSIEANAFIPATDYQLSKRFYLDLGFNETTDESGIAYLHHGKCSFLLQSCDHADRAPMMHLLVQDVQLWHQHVINADLTGKYNVQVTELTEQPWGMREFTITDPDQTLWRIAQSIQT